MDIDDLIESFENHWNQHASPSIPAFLESCALKDSADADLLCELIKVDIHRRWKVDPKCETRSIGSTSIANQPSQPSDKFTEDYARRFPIILDAADYPYAILAEELLARLNAGSQPQDRELAKRFPDADATRLCQLLADASTYHTQHADQLKQNPALLLESMEKLTSRFAIRELLGQGGMGRVYLAEDPRLKRMVAIKVPHSHLRADPQARARFVREGRAAGAINHPNVVTVYETGDDDDECYIVSEYVPGPSLKDWMAGQTKVKRQQAADLVRLLARALQAAHDCGVLHRDLKPGNILLEELEKPDESGNSQEGTTVQLDNQLYCPQITDFGLADFTDSNSDLTTTGALLGTAAYMSPEQIEGKADQQGDVFALGIVLYELLTGESPFARETYAATIDQVRGHEPTSPHRKSREIDLDLSAICECALRKEKSQRYSTAADFADDLQRYLSGQAVRARAVGPVGKSLRWARRNPFPASLLTVIFLSLIWSLWQNQRLGTLLATSEVLREKASVAQSELRSEVYLQDMVLAYNDWNQRNTIGVRRLLEKQIPKEGSEDLRGSDWHLLHRLNETEKPLEFIGHQSQIRSLRVSQDGNSLFSTSLDGTLRKWNARDQTEIWQRSFEKFPPSSLHVAQDSNELYAGTDRVHRINIDDGSTLAILDGLSSRSPIYAIARTTGGMSAVVLSHMPLQIVRQDSHPGSDSGSEALSTEIVPSFRCRRIAFSKDGKRLYFAKGGLNRIRPAFVVWNIVDEAVEAEHFPPGPELLGSVDVSPRTGLVAVAGDALHLYDPDSSKWVASFSAMPSMPMDVEFSSSGDQLACACKDGSLVILQVSETPSLKVMHSIKCSEVDLNCVTWLDENQVVTGDDAGRIKLHTLPQPIRQLAEFTGYAEMIRQGRWIFTQPDGGMASLVDCESLETIFQTNELQGKRIDACEANPSGTHLAIVSGKTAYVWDLQSKSLVGKFDHEPIRANEIRGPWRMLRVALDDDGHVATTGHVGNDFSVQIRDVAKLDHRVGEASFSGLTVGIDFSTDGKRIAVTHFDGLSLFELDGMKRTDLRGYRGMTKWLSPTKLLLRDRAKSFYLYDLESSRFTHTFGTGNDAHTVGTFVPLDDRTLLTQGVDGLRLWDWDSRRLIGFVPINSWACGPSPDGTRLWLLGKSSSNVGGKLLEMRLR